jgi:hypothetical protein
MPALFVSFLDPRFKNLDFLTKTKKDKVHYELQKILQDNKNDTLEDLELPSNLLNNRKSTTTSAFSYFFGEDDDLLCNINSFSDIKSEFDFYLALPCRAWNR